MKLLTDLNSKIETFKYGPAIDCNSCNCIISMKEQ